MSSQRLTPHILKTAWKVADTVFDHYKVTAPDRDRMLQAATVIALADVVASDLARWTAPPPEDSVPVFGGPRSVRLKKDPNSRYRFREAYREEDADQAYDDSEDLFERYQLPDDERASLYSALPCLGLSVLDRHLKWTAPPPFL